MIGILRLFLSRFALPFAFILCAATTWGQGRLGDPGRLGLVQEWSKPVGNTLGGKVTGITLHVSNQNKYEASQVTDRYGRQAFFTDHDPLGAVSRGGYNQTLRRAELARAAMAARGLSPTVQQISIPDSTLYVRSNLGTVTAMDAETGHTKWVVQAGSRGYPSHAVAANDEYVVAISSAKMYLLNAIDGQLLETKSTRNLPSGTPVIDGGNIYLPTWRGLIEVYSTENLNTPIYTLGSPSRIVGSLTVSAESVSWANTKGQFYVAHRGRAGVRYRLKTNDHISAPPKFVDGDLYLASTDGFVYAVDEHSGEIKWRFAAGGSVSNSPLVAEGTVYVADDDGQLIALDAQSGQENWNIPNVDYLVSVGKSKLYCILKDGRLAGVDAASGQIIGTLSVGRLADLRVVNDKTDRLYLVANGMVRCFREADQLWPIVRQPNLDKKEDEKPKPKSITTETPEVSDDSPSASGDPNEGGGDFDAGDDGDDEDIFGVGGFGDEGDAFDGGDAMLDDGNSSDEDDLFGDF